MLPGSTEFSLLHFNLGAWLHGRERKDKPPTGPLVWKELLEPRKVLFGPNQSTDLRYPLSFGAAQMHQDLICSIHAGVSRCTSPGHPCSWLP